jgi:hypothetical protein
MMMPSLKEMLKAYLAPEPYDPEYWGLSHLDKNGRRRTLAAAKGEKT